MDSAGKLCRGEHCVGMFASSESPVKDHLLIFPPDALLLPNVSRLPPEQQGARGGGKEGEAE